MSVLDQNGKIQALGFLLRWRLTSHALYYKIPYTSPGFSDLPTALFCVCMRHLLLSLYCTAALPPHNGMKFFQWSNSHFYMATDSKLKCHFRKFLTPNSKAHALSSFSEEKRKPFAHVCDNQKALIGQTSFS